MKSDGIYKRVQQIVLLVVSIEVRDLESMGWMPSWRCPKDPPILPYLPIQYLLLVSSILSLLSHRVRYPRLTPPLGITYSYMLLASRAPYHEPHV